MAKRIDAETKAKIIETYLADETLSYRDLAKQFGVHCMSVSNIVNGYFKDTGGIKPDRHPKTKPRTGIYTPTQDHLDDVHAEVMAKYEHPRTSDWMDCITPLHQHKQELEQKIEHKQVELDKAKQEYRDFLATIKQLTEDMT